MAKFVSPNRDYLPTIEYANGDKEWYINGNLHRENDQPAIVRKNGDKQWYVNGRLHRENDLPAIENSYGDKFWYRHGIRHRENDKPAIEYTCGSKWWYYNGNLHRENDRPASIYYNGGAGWWINGMNITSFRNKYLEARKLRAQKKIYFWIIKRLYRPGSESAKKLSEISCKQTYELKI